MADDPVQDVPVDEETKKPDNPLAAKKEEPAPAPAPTPPASNPLASPVPAPEPVPEPVAAPERPPMPDINNRARFTADDYRALLHDENIQRGLYTIRAAEGTQRFANPYRIAFGNRIIQGDMSDHPRRAYGFRNPQGGPNATTASGAYQFLTKTWDGAARRLGLRDFGAESQDIAALYLINQRGGLRQLLAGDVPGFINAVRGEWASLPGAGYGQGEQSMATLQKWFAGDGAGARPDYAKLNEGVVPNDGARYAGPAPAGGGRNGGGVSSPPSTPFDGPARTQASRDNTPFGPNQRDSGDSTEGGSAATDVADVADTADDPTPFDGAPTRSIDGVQGSRNSRGGQPRASSRIAAAYSERLSGVSAKLFGG